MPGRHTNSNEYRFGYNGMEKDPEMKGDGNSYTTEFRQYDPRLGRWLSLDPLMAQLEKWSPYVAFENNPVVYNDPLGLKVAGGPKKGSGAGAPTSKHESGEIWSENDEWKNTTTGNTYIFGDGHWNKSQDVEEHTCTHKLTFLEKLKYSCKKAFRVCKTAISGISVKIAHTLTADEKTRIQENKAEKKDSGVSKAVDVANGFLGLSMDAIAELGGYDKASKLIQSGKFEVLYNGTLKTWSINFFGNKTVQADFVKSSKIDYVAKAASGLKVLKYVQIAGKACNVFGIVMTGAKIISGDQSLKNRPDLAFGAIAFVPGVGWIVSSSYFLGGLIVGDENMEKGCKALQDGSNFVHNWNSNINVDYTMKIACFTAGTLVYSTTGYKEIQDIVIGDSVLSYSFSNNSVVNSKVINVLKREADHVYLIKINDELIEVTEEHPFFVVGKDWVKVKDLEIGDELITQEGDKVKMVEKRYKEGSFIVYNITVEGEHNYFVTSSAILVHNK